VQGVGEGSIIRSTEIGVERASEDFVTATTALSEQAKVHTFVLSPHIFSLILLLLVGSAIVRSAVATRLDSFTLDEAYHIAAGVSYVTRNDFRLNPEHPPLVKLWVGTVMSLTGFHLSPFRQMHDKFDERRFAQQDVFLNNDPDSVQRRSRLAMWALNGLLLVTLGFALRRVFNRTIALGTILFLAIDPTVAAHFPVVMTDLPVALLAATTITLASQLLRAWQWKDVCLCLLALGLTLSAKHSGLVIWMFVALAGMSLAIFPLRQSNVQLVPRRLLKLSVVLLGALVVLWALYSFRFHESRDGSETFNRLLTDKIADVESPAYRLALHQMAFLHAMPRAYIWGLADTVHAGLEGRAISQLAFGRLYYNKAPRFFFPGVLAVKLPIGLSILGLLGVWFFVRRRLPSDWEMPLLTMLAALVWFLAVLSSGATYGGVRHALPVLALFSIFGGVTAHVTLSSGSKAMNAVAILALLAACVSALPAVRPWEYYNEFVGGNSNAYQYFDDEGIDLGQRAKELANYYQQNVFPSREIPYIDYWAWDEELQSRGVDWVGHNPTRDQQMVLSPIRSGTTLADAKFLGRRLWWDAGSLRVAKPIARFGNLLVFRGNFNLPGKTSAALYDAALQKIFTEKAELQAAESMLKQAAALDPEAFFVNVELGNVRLRLGSRDGALSAYQAALQHVPNDPSLRQSIEHQIQRVSVDSLDQIPALHDPGLE